MSKCVGCGKLIPGLSCKDCPPVVTVKCAKCGYINRVENDAKKKRKKA